MVTTCKQFEIFSPRKYPATAQAIETSNILHWLAL